MPDDQASKQAALREKLETVLDTRGVACLSCRAVCVEYVNRTDIYGTRDWIEAVRFVPDQTGGRVEMDGILHRPGPGFAALFGRTSFGYAADAHATCAACGRSWHYRADYHFGIFDGRLTMFEATTERDATTS